MWIRSQDKKRLVNATSIFLSGQDNGIFAYDFCGVAHKLGVFKVKERAIEVLDDIQKCILGINKKRLAFSDDGRVSGIENIKMTSDFYQMPKE